MSVHHPDWFSCLSLWQWPTLFHFCRCASFTAFTLHTNSVRFLVGTNCLCRAFFQLVLLAPYNQHHCVSGGDGCYGTTGQTWRTACRHWLFTLKASQKGNCDQMHLCIAVGNVLHETSSHCISVACVVLQRIIWIVSFLKTVGLFPS